MTWSSSQTGRARRGPSACSQLVTYRYDRPWPESLDFAAILTGFGAVAVVLCALLAVRRLREHALVGLFAFAMVWTAWGADVYMVKVAPHWGQREILAAYYADRSGPDEPVVAYQMNWKGENFYAGNQIPAFVSSGATFTTYLKQQRDKGVHVMYFVTEHGRIGGLKGEVQGKSYREVTDKNVNNKFVLVRAEIQRSSPRPAAWYGGAMLTLYGHANRTAANILKLRVALAEAGAEYRYVVLDLAAGEQHKPAYQAINPHGKVPCLVDDDFALPESDAILWYIAEKYPKAALVPSDVKERARVRQWCDFASTSLYTSSYDLFTHTTQADPENRSSWVRGRAQAALDRALTVLDKRLAGREHVATSAFTIADGSIASVLHMLRTRSQLAPGTYPNVEAFYERVARRPSWAKAVASTP